MSNQNAVETECPFTVGIDNPAAPSFGDFFRTLARDKVRVIVAGANESGDILRIEAAEHLQRIMEKADWIWDTATETLGTMRQMSVLIALANGNRGELFNVLLDLDKDER